MKNRGNSLIAAIVLGLVVAFLSWSYMNSRIAEFRPKKIEKLARVKKSILPGTQLVRANLEEARVPAEYAPKAGIRYEDVTPYVGQELTVEVKAGDYLLENYFGVRETVANRLSGLISGENVRAASLPIDDTSSLGRSIVPGDRVDVVFTFSLPYAQQKMSTVLFQNVQVLTTGGYSASEQEVGDRGGRQRPYNIVTLLLPTQDAVRLNYARQAGQVSLLLRSAQDTTVLQLDPILTVADILSPADRDRVEVLRRKSIEDIAPAADKLREQLKEVFEKQRQQTPVERR